MMTQQQFEKISELWFAGDREIALSLASHIEDQFMLVVLEGRIWDNVSKIVVHNTIHTEVNMFGSATSSSPCFRPHILSDIRIEPARNHTTAYYTTCFGRGNQAWGVADYTYYILLTPIQPNWKEVFSQKQPLRSYTIDM